MAEIRASVWIGAGVACAAALGLVGASLYRDVFGSQLADTPDGDRIAVVRARSGAWPPRGPEHPLPAAPRPRPPVTRENLREMWDAEDAAARLVVERGLDGGVEIPEPPRMAGESHDAHLHRIEAVRRRALADVLLTHMRMRDYYESTELPQGLPSREEVRAVRRLPRYADARERTEALRSAAARLDELAALGVAPDYSETGPL